MSYAVRAALGGTGPVMRQGTGKPSMQYLARQKRRAISMGLAKDDSPEAIARERQQQLADQLAAEGRAEQRQIAAEERAFGRQKELLGMRQAMKGAPKAVTQAASAGTGTVAAAAGRPMMAENALPQDLQQAVRAGDMTLTAAMNQARARRGEARSIEAAKASAAAKETAAAAKVKKAADKEADDYEQYMMAMQEAGQELGMTGPEESAAIETTIRAGKTPTQFRAELKARSKERMTMAQAASVSDNVERFGSLRNNPARAQSYYYMLEQMANDPSATQQERDEAMKSAKAIRSKYGLPWERRGGPREVLPMSLAAERAKRRKALMEE